MDITRKKIVNPAEAVGFSFTAGKTSGSTVDFGGEDEKTVILFNNTGSNAGTATIEAGDGIQGVSDLTVNVPVRRGHCKVRGLRRRRQDGQGVEER